MGRDAETASAVVCRGTGKWKVEDVCVDTKLGPMEVLVSVVAAGLCHTDLIFASTATEASGLILGHEGKPIGLFDGGNFHFYIANICTISGSGYVCAVGSEVQDLSSGDPVLLSFASCTACQPCTTGHPAFSINLTLLCAVFRQ
jgi:Zn-dependent alcohol dehydrogenase